NRDPLLRLELRIFKRAWSEILLLRTSPQHHHVHLPPILTPSTNCSSANTNHRHYGEDGLRSQV
ncbi:unnamed protein product, partial [Ascophyllum nodosum]